ncbi:2-oxo-4-hydroxy-4-carboxy-5-ureidoimidazoline decarboxylase [Parasediminibacterium sp. JCM 36343]|uniref:2-oxo-4-hydroxy-4-carboxy-5-ureidoimidazoline decarboxylase n=1 Tax=Parasediminibacterium sp. JCM 36343 TaxID=3374279 RepID=UPI003978C601
MTLINLNNLPREEAIKQLATCNGSTKWQQLLAQALPIESEAALVEKAAEIWYEQCTEKDWLEAFNHHPKIGDIKSLTEKFASTQHLAGNEQSGVQTATKNVLESLAQGNEDYEEKFGFIFIVCATGKTADEMLRLLQDRIVNTYEEELAIAMGEQQKISILRFKKLMTEGNWGSLKASHITTHVLDTSLGKPGQNITIRLQKPVDGGWQTITQGVTNADGRIGDLLASGRFLKSGSYRMLFDTASYYVSLDTKTFYPEVPITFTVFDNTHYHVPLLINPFGYSTYRGS